MRERFAAYGGSKKAGPKGPAFVVVGGEFDRAETLDARLGLLRPLQVTQQAGSEGQKQERPSDPGRGFGHRWRLD